MRLNIIFLAEMADAGTPDIDIMEVGIKTGEKRELNCEIFLKLGYFPSFLQYHSLLRSLLKLEN